MVPSFCAAYRFGPPSLSFASMLLVICRQIITGPPTPQSRQPLTEGALNALTGKVSLRRGSTARVVCVSFAPMLVCLRVKRTYPHRGCNILLKMYFVLCNREIRDVGQHTLELCLTDFTVENLFTDWLNYSWTTFPRCALIGT